MTINVTPDVVWNGSDAFASTSFNMPIPTGIVAGMVLVTSVVFVNAQTNLTSVSIAGWTQISVSGQTEFNKYFFFKVATSGDAAGGNWVCTCQDGFVEAWAGAGWSGVDNTTPFAVGPATNHGVTTSFPFGSLTSPGTGSVWVGLASIDENSGTITDPASPVVRQSFGQFSGFDASALVYSALVNSGAFAPSGSIVSGFEWATVGVFLNPASAGGITLTGQTATFTKGSVTPSVSMAIAGKTATFTEGAIKAAVAKALAGQSASFTAGTLGKSLTLGLTGQTGTFTGGTISASGNLTLALTGLTSTFSAGTLAPAQSTALTGQAATFTEGALTPSASTALSGQTATFTAGTLLANTSIGLQSQSATFTQGTITASGAGNLTLALTGQSATFSEGSIGVASAIGVTGQSASFTPGSISAQSIQALLGSTASFTPGTLTPSASFGLLGENATFTQGTITVVGGDLTLSLSGLTASFSAGQMIASGGDQPNTLDTHDGGTQVIRESHYRKVLKLKPKKGVQRADLVAEAVLPLTTSIAIHTDDDDVLIAYLDAEEAEIDQLTQIAGHLVTQLTRK